jgi:hypothetical protein
VLAQDLSFSFSLHQPQASPYSIFIMSEQRKAVIKNADMEEKMQQDAVDIASKALSEYNIEKVCTDFAARTGVPIHASFI